MFSREGEAPAEPLRGEDADWHERLSRSFALPHKRLSRSFALPHERLSRSFALPQESNPAIYP